MNAPAKNEARDLIAIIGIGCRFPGGAHDPRAYLELLERSGDAVVETPADRWSQDVYCDDDPSTPGRTHVRRGGYLQQDVFSFDPGFFGISPREAASIDPQQRLLMEVAWEAFEDAGVTRSQLAGAPVGVFIGGFTLDNMLTKFAAANVDAIDNHTATSSSMTLLSNRLSYVFDLRGPSLTIDTACSSSLVAVHLACEAIRRGECTAALAGGVNVMLQPYYQIVMSKGHFLAPDGRSKTFESSADGYGRGEGAGVVLLKRLDWAIADGDSIHAVIRGSGVNQDGATDGIPMPNEQAQAALCRSVTDRAGVPAETVGYVEAHGTGTRAGDPIECRALGAVYGGERDEPVRVGSVKANMGHLEAAAGIAGLIKSALSVRERRIFAHRPLSAPNPDIPFDALRIAVPQRSEAWPSAGVARAAVNSFGYGGTNAHVLLEEPPARAGRPTSMGSGPRPMPLSARSEEVLADLAGRLADQLAGDDAPAFDDVRAALAHRRTHHAARACVVASDRAEALEGLRALAAGEPAANVVGAETPLEGLVWVYTGMGPQHWQMGRDLLEHEPIFRAAVEEVDALFVAHAGRSILEEMRADEGASRMARNDVAQPANFVLQVGLTTLLRARGPAPDAILGHSVGEVAAAWAAGCLSLEDAVKVSICRSRLQQRAAGTGGMLAVGCAADDAPALIGERTDVVIAAYNSASMVTLAGPHDGLSEVAARCEAGGVFHKGVRVEVPYHSPAMDPFEAEMKETLSEIAPSAPSIPLYSTALGARVEGAAHDGAYWWTNTRGAVYLQPAVELALDDGHRVFLEVGPHPVLGGSIKTVMSARGEKGATLSCLRRNDDERRTFARALGSLYALGLDLEWDALAPEGAPVALPLTPWRRSHHWAETPEAARLRKGIAESHPLRAERSEGPDGAIGTRIDGRRFAFVRDHRVDGSVVVPGALFVEACLAELPADEVAVLEDVSFERALVLEERAAVRVVVRAEGAALRVESKTASGEWTRHASARRLEKGRYRVPAPLDLDALRAKVADSIPIEGFYARLEGLGLAYGPAFRGVRKLWRSGDECLAELALGDDSPTGWRAHPALLDAALQVLVAAVDDAPPGAVVMPVGLERLWSRGPLGDRAICHAEMRPSGEDGVWIGDLTLTDTSGDVVAQLRGLRCATVGAGNRERGWTHVTRWEEVDLEDAATDEGFAIDGDGLVLMAELTAALGHHDDATHRVIAPASRDAMGVVGTQRLASRLQRAVAQGHRVTVLTRGAYRAAPGDEVDPAQAALVGLCRVAMNEHPELGLRIIDLGRSLVDAAAVARAVRGSTDEELALRVDGSGGAAALALRVERVASADLEREGATEGRAGLAPVALEVGQPGRLDSLRFRALRPARLEPGEVEVDVEAASVNFKDVMKAMGMLSDTALENAYLGRELGLEAAGVVRRVGSGVTHVGVGDPVFVYQGGALRSRIVVREEFVVRRPDDLDARDAACVFVMLTAWYALVHAGRVRSGETVLVHSAAGGVGLAAVQIARIHGARVIATAGTEAKRARLRAMGVERVFDSRTLDFVDEVRAATGGRGVDVVVNALSGEALVKSFGLLASGGRFLELGKTDIAEDRALGMLPFNRSVSFHAIDLDRMATERPEWFRPVADEVMRHLSVGVLRPLPRDVYPLERAEEAFRALASGEQIGKVVLDFTDRSPDLPALPAHGAPVGDRSTWLVTGGLGGFGLRSAEWLAARGVGHLVLVSRRGRAVEDDAVAVERLRARGVEVSEVALDVTDQDAVCRLIEDLAEVDPPLRGIVHAAAVIADGPLSSLSPEQIAKTMQAKADGAWALHVATQNVPLDHFVLYGSISGWVGNPGQAAYAAANAALDGLATRRVARGLPATCISWGAIGDVGMVARDGATRAHLASLGLSALDPKLGLDTALSALVRGPANVCVVDIDWNRWTRAVPGTGWKRLEAVTTSDEAGGALDPLAHLRALEPAERRDAVVGALVGIAARGFRMREEELDPSRSLRDQGLDSIVAVELGLAIHQALGVELSAMDLLSGKSVHALAELVLGRLGEPAPEPAPEPEAASAERVEDAATLRSRILVSAPYDVLEDLAVAGDRLTATIGATAGHDAEVAAMPAAEVGRHLAILGSMACARAWGVTERYAWPVAEAELELASPPPGPSEGGFVLEASSVRLDRAARKAWAAGVIRTADGALVGELRVGYHAMPARQLRTLFEERARVTHDLDGESPYLKPWPAPTGAWEDGAFVCTLPTVRVEDCKGHFPGLPALPVSILGRHVLSAVIAAIGDGRADAVEVAVRSCTLETERFVWAGEGVRIRTRPSDDGWRCDVETHDGEAVGRFVLDAREVRTQRAA